MSRFLPYRVMHLDVQTSHFGDQRYGLYMIDLLAI